MSHDVAYSPRPSEPEATGPSKTLWRACGAVLAALTLAAGIHSLPERQSGSASSEPPSASVSASTQRQARKGLYTGFRFWHQENLGPMIYGHNRTAVGMNMPWSNFKFVPNSL